MVVAGSLVLLTAVLIECCFAERHESIWFQLPATWKTIAALAIGAMLLTGLGDLYVRAKREQASVDAGLLSLRRLPKTRTWVFMILFIAFVSVS
jgi:hypothetical protein